MLDQVVQDFLYFFLDSDQDILQLSQKKMEELVERFSSSPFPDLKKIFKILKTVSQTETKLDPNQEQKFFQKMVYFINMEFVQVAVSYFTQCEKV